MSRSLRGAGAAVLFASLVCAQAGPGGHWEGSFAAENRSIGVSLDLDKNAKSEWVGSMGVPSEGATGLVVTNIAVNGNSVKFVAVELMMATVDLTLGPDGVMKGTISGPQRQTPVEFKRTGEAKVKLIPPSPAVSKELEGDWEASFQTPGGAMRLAFHFKNQPDGTVAATIDGINGSGLPLNDVRQSGPKVEFGVKIAGASFEGTLNKEGTQIAGQFMHDGNGMPMMLKKM